MRNLAGPALTMLALSFVPAADAVSQLRDVEGSKDHPMVSRYAGSIVIGYEAKEFDEFELPLGPLERAATTTTWGSRSGGRRRS
ncbi:MAG: hypothetical protein H0V09_08080 [Gemmatimonadetes bacterium]|nr:hypothetical protein [Gemmatimonadota bacterium]